MSVDIPKLAIALGAVGVSQGDVIEARVHLGATKEVSSWSCFCRIGIRSIVLAGLIRLLLVKMVTLTLGGARMFHRLLLRGPRASNMSQVLMKIIFV